MPPHSLDRLFFGSRLHESADPAQRVLGAAALAPDAPALLQLLAGDPAAEVRCAAAARCGNPAALLAALSTETDSGVRGAVAEALGGVLAASADPEAALNVLVAPECTDAVRAELALRASDDARRRAAIAGIADEDELVRIALGAGHASVRLAAAERVHSAEPLRRMLKGSLDKDRGVARLARERLDAIQRRIEDAATADALLRDAEALAERPGPIVMAAVELDRRWKALALDDDVERLARWQAIGSRMKDRFERDLEEQRAHAQLEQRVDGWLASLDAQASISGLPAVRESLEQLRAAATEANDSAVLARLDGAAQRVAQWEQAAHHVAAAEAIVVEAEELAAGTTIDDAQLRTRWEAIDAAGRTQALGRRLDAALRVIEQRRDAYVRAHQQDQVTARHQWHAALHDAEQALAAGQLREARAAAERTRELKLRAGALPKPSIQRLSRVVQQLTELEKWEKFGQQTARVELCERAEGLPQKALAPTALAREVQQLRAEWKKLDEQHAGVPRPLWERFDGACERAYAPAARHFAEQAALHKQARKARQDFVAAADAHVPTLLGEPRDWRAIERWLRETETTWRGTTLGSVDPGAWKKLDARLKAALAPLHAALAAARGQARQEREAFIGEAEALAQKGAERDVPARIKDLQARWQAHARSIVLPRRDENALWDRFRAACQAAFEARQGSRREEDRRRHDQHRAFETLCERLEQLAHADAVDEAEAHRVLREVRDQWSKAAGDSGAAPAPLETRFKRARAGVDDLLRRRGRAVEADAWKARFAKERLCEELDALVLKEGLPDAAELERVRQAWSELPALSADWEGRLAGRRDAALHALGDDEDARYDLADRIKRCAAERGDALLELELMFGIASPPDLQKERLAVQVRELRDRFKRTASGGAASAADVLLKWFSLPGVAEARDRQRCERIVAGLERRR